MMQPQDDEKTGLPGLRTWRQVYVAVIVVFVAWVVLLAALGRAFP
ncbi:MAG TPA: hypothetical protein VFE25_07170 [Opitutaceae bacterium]|jgi:hypothetical protein|nr:hypothetical protein [Opitutaceae bacterium]